MNSIADNLTFYPFNPFRLVGFALKPRFAVLKLHFRLPAYLGSFQAFLATFKPFRARYATI